MGTASLLLIHHPFSLYQTCIHPSDGVGVQTLSATRTQTPYDITKYLYY